MNKRPKNPNRQTLSAWRARRAGDELSNEALSEIENQPGFRQGMEKSEADIRAGRLVSLEELEKQVRVNGVNSHQNSDLKNASL
jgi:hypothetical protein